MLVAGSMWAVLVIWLSACVRPITAQTCTGSKLACAAGGPANSKHKSLSVDFVKTIDTFQFQE